MNDEQLLRYSRHILLNEIDVLGQEKLLSARVLVVGCGGLGTAVLPYLASAGVGQLLIADDDVIETSNLQRQVCYTEQDIGRNKAESMRDHLCQINSACCVEVFGRLSEEDLNVLLPDCAVVVDCSDNFATRQAVNRACVAHKKPLVSGAVVRFDGQVAVYRPDLPDQACYACLFDVADGTDGVCVLFGVFAPLVGVIGTTQACEVLKIILGLPTQNGVLRCYNALSGEWQHFHASRKRDCRVCACRA